MDWEGEAFCAAFEDLLLKDGLWVVVAGWVQVSYCFRFRLSKQTVQRLVMDALRAVELQDLAERPTTTLSGGQKQRVAIAGALAQNPKAGSP